MEFKWDDKHHQGMMQELQKGLGREHFEFKFAPEGRTRELLRFNELPLRRGQQHKEVKRFFDEPFFQTPEGKKRTMSAPKGQTKLRTEVARAREATRDVAVIREQALQGAARARTQALRDATIARSEAVKALTETRASRAVEARPGTAGSSELDALRKRMAALEAELAKLREENARLKGKGKNPPPPKVELKSKRLRV
jgi:hypothetical protein